MPQGCRSSCAWQFPHYGVHEHHVFSQSPALDEAPGLRAGHQGTNNGTIICTRAAPAASLHGLLRRFCLRRLALLRPPSLRRLAPPLPMLSSSSRSSSSPRDLAVHDCDQRRIPTSVPALCSSRSSSPMLASRRASHQHSPPPLIQCRHAGCVPTARELAAAALAWRKATRAMQQRCADVCEARDSCQFSWGKSRGRGVVERDCHTHCLVK